MRQARIREMLRVIENEFAYAAPITGRKALDDRVIAAMGKVPLMILWSLGLKIRTLKLL
jgi:hypothetical protein